MTKQLPIATLGMQVLRDRAKRVKEINSDIIRLIQDMFHTMDLASGIGLAAPQINESISLAVVDISGIEEHKKEKPLVLLNPEILETSGETVSEEGCLSIPGIRASVTRPDKILLKYNDLDMNEVRIELEGFISRVCQHEIDHLQGKLFIDYLSNEQKKEFRKHLSLVRKGKVKTDYPILISGNGK